jgi:hypothetical protein
MTSSGSVNSFIFIHCRERFSGQDPGHFSREWNAYDSLGEVYMNNGEKSLAIVNYEKSLEINGSNSGALDALKKLKGAP